MLHSLCSLHCWHDSRGNCRLVLHIITLMMTTDHSMETSVTGTNNNPSQD